MNENERISFNKTARIYDVHSFPENPIPLYDKEFCRQNPDSKHVFNISRFFFLLTIGYMFSVIAISES